MPPGIAKLYQRLSRRLSFDVTYVLSQSIPASGVTESPQQNPACCCRVILADALLATAHDEQFSVTHQTVEAMINDGLVAIGAFVDDQLVGLSFFATDRVDPIYNRGSDRFKGIGIQLPKNGCYQFKVFVLPSYRGSGINGCMIDHGLSHFKCGEVDTVITTTDISNRAFVNSVRKKGLRVIGYAGEWVIFGRSFFWIPRRIQAAKGEYIQLFRPKQSS